MGAGVYRRFNTISEVAEVIQNRDKEGIIELGRRMPLVLYAFSRIADNEDCMALLSAMPEYVTPTRIERTLRSRVRGLEVGDIPTQNEETAKEEHEKLMNSRRQMRFRAKKEEEKREEERRRRYGEKEVSRADTETLSGEEIDTSPADVFSPDGPDTEELENEAFEEAEESEADVSLDDEPDAVPIPVEDEPEEDGNTDYSKIKAVDLYKECKKRGLKAASRKPQAYYIELLEADDEENRKLLADEAAEIEAGTDDFEEEEFPPEPEPAKPAKEKKPAAKKAKASPKTKKEREPAPEPEPEKKEEAEDDEGEWEI